MKKKIKKRRIKKSFVLVVTIFICILVIISAYLIFNNPFLTISLIGNKEIKVKVGEEYKDAGVGAKYLGKDISEDVVKTSISTDKVGKQIIEYKIQKLLTIKKVERIIIVEKTEDKKNTINNEGANGYTNIEMGPKYVKGILVANKKYALPKDFGDGVDDTAYDALQNLQSGATVAGFDMPMLSGYRSYETQVTLYQRYADRDGVELADTYSARAGHSEHQTGLAFDVGQIDNDYGETAAGKWLAQNCAEYGFILRYQKGKEYITGYQYEPWHIRYVGTKVAKEIMGKGITLEEYLNLV